MMKYTIIAFGLFASKLAFGGDDTLHVRSAEPPVRRFYKDGSPIPQQRIETIHEKDCDPNGWRYNILEWMRHDLGPRHDKDPDHGDNNGWEIAGVGLKQKELFETT